MSSSPEGQDEVPRKELVAGSVTAEEKAVIEQAREVAGYKRMSHFVRDVMLARSRLILTPKRRHERVA